MARYSSTSFISFTSLEVPKNGIFVAIAFYFSVEATEHGLQMGLRLVL